MKGYSGRVLHVDLSSSTFEVERPSESFYRGYVGGACMGAYYLLRELKAGIDAFSPENVVVFSTSAIVGAPISGSARHCVTSKSPLTGGIASSEAGGFWAPELRFAGFDAVVIRGRAAKPVYIWIHDGEYELRDATQIWGKITGESQDAIREELEDQRIRVLQIGPAGERLVRFAAITNELKHFNGRAGLGAVMGSKNLKAIAVRGSKRPEFHDLEKIQEIARRAAKKVNAEGFWKDWKQYGTLLNVSWNTALGGLPTRNWTMGTFAEADKLSAETYAKKMMDKSGTCWGCVQACKRDLKQGIEQPYRIEARYGGPEYETVGMCGSNCMVSDLNAIAKVNEIASSYCMDTISLGGVVGFVMECFEEGLVTKEDTGGIEARFGNADALVRLCELVGKREGFGDQMAEGTARLSARLGPRAERMAVHVKGKEFPAHMPTSKSMMALAYAFNPFGPDHVSSEHDGAIADEPGESLQGVGIHDSGQESWRLSFAKSKLMAYSQRFISAIDSLSVCQFCFNTWSIFNLEELLEVLNAATGWRFTMQELMLLGERRINLSRAFNQREGFTSSDDDLPLRLFEDPLRDEGPGHGRTVDRELFYRCREEYYQLNGWDIQTGNPTVTKLKELELGWVADLLARRDER